MDIRKLSKILIVILILSLTITGCSGNNSNNTTTPDRDYSLYNIKIEVVDSDSTDQAVGNATLRINDYDGVEQTADYKDNGIYQFENIKLQQSQEIDIEINKTGYQKKTVSVITDNKDITKTGEEAVKLEIKENADVQNIDEKGGELSLKNDLSVEIPKDSLKSENEVILVKEDEEKFIADNQYENNIYRISIPVENFSKEIKIKYPLTNVALRDIEDFEVNLIDENTGFKFDTEFDLEIVEKSDGICQLVISTSKLPGDINYLDSKEKINNKSLQSIKDKLLSISFLKKQTEDKKSVSPMKVPFYSQGDTPRCWAAGLQMLRSTYSSSKKAKNTWDILGEFKIEEGMSFLEARFGDDEINLDKFFQNEINMKVEKKLNTFKSISAIKNNIKEQLTLGRPIYFGYNVQDSDGSHVIIIVGYEENNKGLEFYYQDPATEKIVEKGTFDEIGVDYNLSVNTNIFQLYVPANINNRSDYSEATINILDESTLFKTEEGYWQFNWSHNENKGYNYRALGDKDTVSNHIPKTVKYLLISDLIIANSYQDLPNNLKFEVEIVPENNPSNNFIKEFVIDDNELENLKYTKLSDLIDSKSVGEEYFLNSIQADQQSYEIIFSLKNDQEIINKTKIKVKLNHEKTEIKFADQNFEEAIRDRINKEQGPIYKSDVEAIIKLDVSNSNISSIKGIENLKNLEILNLGPEEVDGKLKNSNSINDISYLSDLTALDQLDISYNIIDDISPLLDNAGLKSGDRIDMRENNLDLSEGSKDLSNIKDLSNKGIEVIYDDNEEEPITAEDKFAFVEDNSIWILDLENNNVDKLTEFPDEGSLDIEGYLSRENIIIAERVTGEQHFQKVLYSVDVSSGGKEKLTKDNLTIPGFWRKRGKIFLNYCGNEDDYNSYEIYKVNVVTGKDEIITNNSKPEMAPVLSPDGQRILFASVPKDEELKLDPNPETGGDLDLYTMNKDGTNRSKLADNRGYHDGVEGGPIWLANKSKILFASAPTATTREEKWDYYIINTDGSSKVKLSDYFNVSKIIDGSISEDRNKMCFENGTGDIHIGDFQTGDKLKINTSQNFYYKGAFSPDNSKVLLVKKDPYEIYIANTITGEVKRLDQGRNPEWNSDGTKVIYKKGDYPNINYYVIDIETKTTNKITNKEKWTPNKLTLLSN